MSTVLIFLIVIVVLVVAHELGHFFAARAFGVRVDEFGVGYPPRARKLFRWKETQFTLNWLPFGGFVKIVGEEAGGEEVSGSFAFQKMWKRVLIIAAGIIANMLLAVVLYSLSFGIGFLAEPGTFPESIPTGPAQTLVTDVFTMSPASVAGIASGDVISKLSSKNDVVEPKSTDDVTTFIARHASDTIVITLAPEKTVTLTPRDGHIGIALVEVSKIRLPFFSAIRQGIIYTGQEFISIIHGLGAIITAAFHGGGGVLSEVSGPVGIAQIAGQAYALGFGSFLAFVALISVNLAVINLLPFPALDGGRLILELFASRGRSRIPKRVVAAVNQIGFLLLILLMIYVTYHDISRLFTS